ncbi:MAG: O-antigen ligase family protein [Candidatus Komeilibacteria bacterium]|nr:O-antigen ligase family protein [Candidatus Komeilibacteria bacterium]
MLANYFTENLFNKHTWLILIGLVLFSFILFFLNAEVKTFLILLLLLIFITRWISYYLPQAVLALIALSPFINWQIHLTSTVSAPPADLLGIVILLAWLWKIIRENYGHNQLKTIKKINWPALGAFGLFLVIAVISATQSFFIPEGLKYLTRFIILSYLVYIFLIVNVITQHQHFIRLIKIYFFTCLLIAVLSFLQYLYNFDWHSIPRLTPFFLNNFAPLGSNHNLLAELLIPAIPLGMILIKLRGYQPKLKNKLLAAVIFIGLVSLLTLSRGGWLALALVIGLTVILLNIEAKHQFNLKNRLKNVYKKLARPVLLTLLVVILIAIPFLTSNEVSLSNTNRLLQWQIGWDTLSFSPYLGAGPGSFMEIINRDPFFVREFGGNLEAHGWPLKILAETGWLGLATFIIFLIWFFGKKIKIFIKRKNLSCQIIIGYALIAAASAVTLQLFTTSYFTAKMWLPLGILAAAINIYGTKNARQN